MFFGRKINKEKIIKKYGKDNVYFFENGDYKYFDKNCVEHLIRNKKELCQGLFVFSYDNGDYKYLDKNGIYHLIRKNKEICQGIAVYSYEDGDYSYKDKNGDYFLKDKNGEEIKNDD